MLMIVLIEHIKKLAEDTSLSEHINKCKLTIHIDCTVSCTEKFAKYS